ncbi:hypothetical protein CDV31_007084 [Fusarium ambrosium]|uniref:Uncharacterized protein n=1 Tax=Fusarium ambrosium TaxID=131363 RepID=A0A428U920_9HYPO|nr:hypothetical protein CDV31_007084 [Fusarium ambrosium]
MGMGGKKEFAARKMEMSLTDGLAYDYPYFWVFFYQVTDSQITHQWSLKNRKQAISVQYYDKGAQHHTVVRNGLGGLVDNYVFRTSNLSRLISCRGSRDKSNYPRRQGSCE